MKYELPVFQDDRSVLVDDRAAAHLEGMSNPAISLLRPAGSGWGRRNEPAVEWSTCTRWPTDGMCFCRDLIPGARGFTPQSCAFRDHDFV